MADDDLEVLTDGRKALVQMRKNIAKAIAAVPRARMLRARLNSSPKFSKRSKSTLRSRNSKKPMTTSEDSRPS